MKINLLNVIDHEILRKKNNILLKALKNKSGEDKIIRTIANEVVKLIIRLNKNKKSKNFI